MVKVSFLKILPHGGTGGVGITAATWWAPMDIRECGEGKVPYGKKIPCE